ncbi:MAG: hypothetical protein QXR60_02395, partial [Candidatus Nanoarchaeia archaeon]
YNYTLRAPSSAGNYTIKVNTSYQGYYAENEQNFTVQQPENNIPMITSIQYEATVSPLENTTTQISINYTVNDDDGTSDVDNTKHQLIINFSSGETKTNTTCSTSDSGNERTYTCIVEMEFWQPPGTWSINATACDYSNACAESVNETFTYQTLTAMTAEQTSITFPDSYPGQPNVKASSSITIINTGNVNSTTVDVRGFDLKGVDDESIFWDVDNFTAKITDDCGGDQLINNTYVSVTSASLPAGELSTEELFFCITTTPDIKAQTYNTTDELWNIRIT